MTKSNLVRVRDLSYVLVGRRRIHAHAFKSCKRRCILFCTVQCVRIKYAHTWILYRWRDEYICILCAILLHDTPLYKILQCTIAGPVCTKRPVRKEKKGGNFVVAFLMREENREVWKWLRTYDVRENAQVINSSLNRIPSYDTAARRTCKYLWNIRVYLKK